MAQYEFEMQNPGHTAPRDGVRFEPVTRVRLIGTADRSLVGEKNRVMVGPNEFIQYMYVPSEAEVDGTGEGWVR